MTKTLLAVTLCTAFTLPAFAHNNRVACVPTTDANGVTVYYPAPSAKISKRKHAPKKVARVHRSETKTVAAAPAPVIVEKYEEPVAAPAPVRHERTAAEERALWLKNHTPTDIIYGNMSGAAGRSTIQYMHGTDNPLGKIAYNMDQGPSARPAGWDDTGSSTATDSNDEL